MGQFLLYDFDIESAIAASAPVAWLDAGQQTRYDTRVYGDRQIRVRPLTLPSPPANPAARGDGEGTNESADHPNSSNHFFMGPLAISWEIGINILWPGIPAICSSRTGKIRMDTS